MTRPQVAATEALATGLERWDRDTEITPMMRDFKRQARLAEAQAIIDWLRICGYVIRKARKSG